MIQIDNGKISRLVDNGLILPAAVPKGKDRKVHIGVRTNTGRIVSMCRNTRLARGRDVDNALTLNKYPHITCKQCIAFAMHDNLNTWQLIITKLNNLLLPGEFIPYNNSSPDTRHPAFTPAPVPATNKISQKEQIHTIIQNRGLATVRVLMQITEFDSNNIRVALHRLCKDLSSGITSEIRQGETCYVYRTPALFKSVYTQPGEVLEPKEPPLQKSALIDLHERAVHLLKASKKTALTLKTIVGVLNISYPDALEIMVYLIRNHNAYLATNDVLIKHR